MYKRQDPDTPPSIVFNYLEAQQDYKALRAGIEKTREIFNTAAFESYLGKEIAPGASVTDTNRLDDFIKSTLRSTKHPCGTCKMGSDSESVVDGQGKVHGVDQLRVVDASIIPLITTGNTNAPTIMLAEKIADMVRGRSLMPSENIVP